MGRADVGRAVDVVHLDSARRCLVQPIYYDYGTGGNVVYQNNNVYVGGQQVANAADFAMSAADLATVPPPPTPEAAEDVEWMALGTFAVSSNEKETDPSRVMQLAVDKDGIVSGTLFNTQTNEAETVQGRVDKETQRVAMRIGDKENIVVETGLYNLTQDEAPARAFWSGQSRRLALGATRG